MFTNENEAYNSASVGPIHTRSELPSVSDSAYDSASVDSVASVNQPSKFESPHTELNLGYLKGLKFCLESKASFIDISNIASFN